MPMLVTAVAVSLLLLGTSLAFSFGPAGSVLSAPPALAAERDSSPAADQLHAGTRPRSAGQSARPAPPVPSEARAVEADHGFVPTWVAAHAATTLWADASRDAEALGPAYQWAVFYAIRPPRDGRFHVWDPATRGYAWIDAAAVGPIDPTLAGTEYLPPIGMPIAWTGAARITMYTCVELGGCNATASGLWPEVGMVAVDPRVIPLGSTIWIQGLGTFLAADTGSLVKGAHIDVYSESYPDAIAWGVQQLPIVVFAPN